MSTRLNLPKHLQPYDDFKYEITEDGYGKNCVKLLHLRRDGQVHQVKEFEVCTHLKLYTKRDYLFGDNSDIIATDSQKNTVYLLAKKHGVENPERFGLILSTHFLTKYLHVQDVHVQIVEHPWRRIEQTISGKVNSESLEHKIPHNHAFLSMPTEQRFCHVYHSRHDRYPKVISGIKELRVLKTTQSSFINFIDDEYRSLPDTNERIFSTKVLAYWTYGTISNVDYDKCWNTIRGIVLENFAGDPSVGVHSPSVQFTLYRMAQQVLDSFIQIENIKIEMPNIHYIKFDTSAFPKFTDGKDNDVFVATDSPSGVIFAQLNRKPKKSNL